MADICTDNRFELIEKYKKELIESTNIESSQDEMAVLDNLLFRLWQMGWLDRLEEPERKKGKWIWKGEEGDSRFMCSVCKCKENVPTCNGVPNIWEFCPNCGADMREEGEHE